MFTEISKIRSVSPVEMWGDQVGKFVPWLADNLDTLTAALGQKLVLESGGTRPGPTDGADSFVAVDANDSAHRVLIGCRLDSDTVSNMEETLDRAAERGVSTLIWVAPEFSHVQLRVVEWLNTHICSMRFKALRMRVLRIGDSLPALQWEVCSRPEAGSGASTVAGSVSVDSLPLDQQSGETVAVAADQLQVPASAAILDPEPVGMAGADPTAAGRVPVSDTAAPASGALMSGPDNIAMRHAGPEMAARDASGEDAPVAPDVAETAPASGALMSEPDNIAMQHAGSEMAARDASGEDAPVAPDVAEIAPASGALMSEPDNIAMQHAGSEMAARDASGEDAPVAPDVAEIAPASGALMSEPDNIAMRHAGPEMAARDVSGEDAPVAPDVAEIAPASGALMSEPDNIAMRHAGPEMAARDVSGEDAPVAPDVAEIAPASGALMSGPDNIAMQHAGPEMAARDVSGEDAPVAPPPSGQDHGAGADASAARPALWGIAADAASSENDGSHSPTSAGERDDNRIGFGRREGASGSASGDHPGSAPVHRDHVDDSDPNGAGPQAVPAARATDIPYGDTSLAVFVESVGRELEINHGFDRVPAHGDDVALTLRTEHAGISYRCIIGEGWDICARIEFDLEDVPENRRVFEALRQRQGELEESFGQVLSWETDHSLASIAARKRVYAPDLRMARDSARIWTVGNLVKFRAVFGEPITRNAALADGGALLDVSPPPTSMTGPWAHSGDEGTRIKPEPNPRAPRPIGFPQGMFPQGMRFALD